jgi:uncharacterized membrane protein YdfJ with MMPL/SSD domain
MLEHLARFVIAHRRLVLGAWILFIAFGAFSTTRLANRWLEEFSVPGYSAYEANQRTTVGQAPYRNMSLAAGAAVLIGWTVLVLAIGAWRDTTRDA